MKSISIGKLRGLQQIVSERRTFTELALDHRQNLRKVNPAFVDDAELSHFKLGAISALARCAMESAKRQTLLCAVATERLTCLTSLCYALARPFTDFYQAEAPFDLYQTY
ncbi:MAG: hypothetical protein HYZ25_16820 [Chloroflexi bacterium]|nr:hypothetical protein [Chloroflexota bacterium]